MWYREVIRAHRKLTKCSSKAENLRIESNTTIYNILKIIEATRG